MKDPLLRKLVSSWLTLVCVKQSASNEYAPEVYEAKLAVWQAVCQAAAAGLPVSRVLAETNRLLLNRE